MTRRLSDADPQAAGSRLGQVVAGKYRIERLLGRGGMGEVYEARHVVVGRRFAVKFLHAQQAHGRDSLSRFMREAQAAGSLESPHIVAVLDFDTAPDGSPFLVMEYLTGESLATTLAREGRLPSRRALGLVLQACAGLEVAHRAGIVHRDLKPDNLLLTQQDDGTDLLKILDFGIAKLVDSSAEGDATQSGAVLGTPFYMAPEQARGERSVDLRIDVYALGVLAYELLSGKKPHPGAGYNAILAHILTQPIVPLRELRPDLAPALVATIERALAFDPARRHGSAALLASELSAFAGREVPMVDAHFDLRAPAPGVDHPATRTAADVQTQSAVGTLASAVGDVPRSSAEPAPRRRWAWLLVFVVIALVLSVAKGKRSADPSPAQSSASPSAAPNSARSSAPPAAPSVIGTSSASNDVPAPPPAAAASAKPAALRRAPLQKPTPSASARPRATGAETIFDEQNPY